MSSHLKAELAATCSTLGHLHKGNYLIEPECFQSVKDLIHYLKRDNEMHDTRRYLGESKVLQNDLIQIIKSCPKENSDLFGATLRLLINLTTPTLLFYGEDVPVEKIERNIYLSLIGYSQEYKIAFCDVEFWNKICSTLSDLFEIDWTDRSADDSIEIERILMLLRNILQVPADLEIEKRPENDVTVHDKILWTLRQSQILELLLFISSNKTEEQFYLNLLEIFSLILREQNPKLLANCDIQHSTEEKNKDTEDLVKVRELEKSSRNKYLNMRNFNATFVIKGVKSLSNRDIVCHKSLDKVSDLDLHNLDKKQIKARRNRVPIESDRVERRSTFFVRLFLKEFCLEFLNGSFKHLMNVVKNKLDSGKTLANDSSYYFWALKFFLEFATATNSDVNLVKDFLSSESFHFVQTNIDNAFEHLTADKTKTVNWVKRIHLILKSYRSLLETLLWMDCSRSALTRSVSRAIKSQIFYVVEYREMTLHLLLRYDSTKFSISYLRDLIETTHLFIKLLEDYSKHVKLVVQRVKKKKKLFKRRGEKVEKESETLEEKWEKMKDDVYDILSSETEFPEIVPFDAALEIPIDDQKGRAMKMIQKFLHEERIKDGIGLLRSARQVWPENDVFGSVGMSVEDETLALQEICLADLEQVESGSTVRVVRQTEEENERGNQDTEDECKSLIVEQDFDIMDYKKRLVNKKVVEGCGILLRNYKKNSKHTNHCIIKLLHRIGWDCSMPAMLFQASIFWTLLKILKDKSGNYAEIHTFTVNLLRKFRKHATKNPVVFLELLFWKEHSVALEIQHGYEPYNEGPKTSKKTKTKGKLGCAERDGEVTRKIRRIKHAEVLETVLTDVSGSELDRGNEKIAISFARTRKSRKRKNKQQTEEVDKDVRSLISENPNNTFEDGIVNLCAEENPEAMDIIWDESKIGTPKTESCATMNYNGKSAKETSEPRYEIIKSKKSHAKQKIDGVRYIDISIDEENAGGTIDPLSRRKDHRILKIHNQVEKESTIPKSYERASNKYTHICSSDSEEETSLASEARLKTFSNIFEKVSEEKGSRGRIMRRSHAFKKRGREFREEEMDGFCESSDTSNTLKPKKFRFISSDSGGEDFKSEAEFTLVSNGTRKRKRLTVIDSDSDVD